MAILEFYFDDLALNKAVVYLRDVNATPVSGLSASEVKDLVRESCIGKFHKEYSGKAAHPYKVNEGVVYGAVVWGGLLCEFGSVKSCSGDPISREVDILAEGSEGLDCVTVHLLINLDRRLNTCFKETHEEIA